MYTNHAHTDGEDKDKCMFPPCLGVLRQLRADVGRGEKDALEGGPSPGDVHPRLVWDLGVEWLWMMCKRGAARGAGVVDFALLVGVGIYIHVYANVVWVVRGRGQ